MSVHDETKETEKTTAEAGAQYEAAPNEARAAAKWERLSRVEPDKRRKPFAVMMPPPNVTGVLHVGHAPYALQDLLIRLRRMQGFDVLWQPGTDHAGIATQHVVEALVARRENKNRYQIGRDELVKRIWAWTEDSGGTIYRQLRRLGASCDWSRARFTLDEGLSRAVRVAFQRLHDAGLLYRGKYLVNWCPHCRTTLSDDEVEHEEVNGKLYELHYPLADNPAQRLPVATTRPETMLGDSAVAVHPHDERWRGFVGRKVRLPLAERDIPVIADSALELGFGTGCLKVTPAHDPVDYQIGLRHKLPQINIMTQDGKLNDAVPERFRGLDRFQARKEVVKALTEAGLMGEIKPHKQQVGHCYRCHETVEPFLTSQWFVSMKPLSELAVGATREGRVKFHPERWAKVYLQWFKDVRDWPISRQIWWGHRIPVWYCVEDNPEAVQKIEAGPNEPYDLLENGRRIRYLIGEKAKPIVAAEDPSFRPEYRGKTLIQDPDVLDTWFSSALWPFSTLGWPDKTADLDYWYPTDVLLTDRGIIYFWVARMVMMGEFLMGREPFKHVVIHGTILDGEGAKMSKSKGNGINPLDIIERYGADALRFTLFEMCTEGQDLRFPVNIVCPFCDEAQDLPNKRTRPTMKCRKCGKEFQQPVPNEPEQPEPPMGRLDSRRFEKGRNFTNKIWNAARFILSACDGAPLPPAETLAAALRDEDRWILSRLNRATAQMSEALETYDFAKAAQTFYAFFWDEFCAWTIELSKPRLRPENAADDRAAARAVLLYVLDRALRLLHPLCPFITEALWDELGKRAPDFASRNLNRADRAAVCAWAAAPGVNESELPERNPVKSLLAESPWPRAEERLFAPELEDRYRAIFEAVRAVRNIRQKNAIAPKTALRVLIRTADENVRKRLDSGRGILSLMAGCAEPEIGPTVEKPKPAGVEALSGAEVYVALEGAVDLDKERSRLDKELEKKRRYAESIEKKLANENFAKNAPSHVVDAERERLKEAKEQIVGLEAARAELG